MADPFSDAFAATASCACGTVAVRIAGPVASMLLCSCLDCQRATGGGHSSVVAVRTDRLEVVGATTAFERPADSGAIFTRHFCPRCGTGIFGQSSRAPGLRLVLVGLFAGNTEWFAPTQLIFARSHPAWDLVPDHLPRHSAYR